MRLRVGDTVVLDDGRKAKIVSMRRGESMGVQVLEHFYIGRHEIDKQATTSLRGLRGHHVRGPIKREAGSLSEAMGPTGKPCVVCGVNPGLGINVGACDEAECILFQMRENA